MGHTQSTTEACMQPLESHAWSIIEFENMRQMNPEQALVFHQRMLERQELRYGKLSDFDRRRCEHEALKKRLRVGADCHGLRHRATEVLRSGSAAVNSCERLPIEAEQNQS